MQFQKKHELASQKTRETVISDNEKWQNKCKFELNNGIHIANCQPFSNIHYTTL